MGHRQYFKKYNPLTDPEVLEVVPVLCPNQGYVDPDNPEDPWVQVFPPYVPDPAIPPVATPLSEESVILICSTAIGGIVDFVLSTSGGTSTYKIYGAGDVQLATNTINSGSRFTYTFTKSMNGYETSDGEKIFKVVFTPTISGQHITQARVYSTTNTYPIIEAYINLPYATAIDFNNAQFLKKCWLCDNMDALNNANYKVFNNTYSLEELRMPLSMNAIATLDTWFGYSNVAKIVLPASMTSLIKFSYTFQYAKAKKIVFPNYVGSSMELKYLLYYTHFVEDISFPETWPTDVKFDSAITFCDSFKKLNLHSGCLATSIYYAVSNCPNFDNETGELIINCKTTITAISYVAVNLPKLKKLRLKGSSANSVTSLSYIIYQSQNIEEVELPESMNGLTGWTSAVLGGYSALKKLILPKSMTGLTGTLILLPSSCVNIEEITTCDNWGTNVLTFSNLGITYAKRIPLFDQPTLRINGLAIHSDGLPNGVLNYIEIAWSYITLNIYLSYQNLSTTEIDRIFTALPVLAGKTIDVRGNPGYAGCNKTIATAKGWVVP